MIDRISYIFTCRFEVRYIVDQLVFFLFDFGVRCVFILFNIFKMLHVMIPEYYLPFASTKFSQFNNFLK